MSKVFVDSSVLYSALASATGTARELLAHAQSDDIALHYSDVVIEEVTRNLERKAPPAVAVSRH